MENFSIVLKVLEGALRQDVTKVHDYSTLLAERLREGGQARQASAVERRLSDVPAVGFQSLAGAQSLPSDNETATAMLDVWTSRDRSPRLVLDARVERAVDEFIEGIEMRDQLIESGVEIASRLLLTGPPGTGKTEIARRIAGSLGMPLFIARSDVMVSSLLGQTSRNIRSVFEFATGRPCVLFLDELDALAKSRDDAADVGELQRVVIGLLQNLDSLQPDTIVVAATNHPGLLDTAVARRFPQRVAIPLPGWEVRKSIWEMHLGGEALRPRDFAELATASAGMSGASIEESALNARRESILQSEPLSLARAMRRVAEVLWYNGRMEFEGEREEVARLRQWNPRVFTYRELASIFNISTRQVRNAVGESA